MGSDSNLQKRIVMDEQFFTQTKPAVLSRGAGDPDLHPRVVGHGNVKRYECAAKDIGIQKKYFRVFQGKH